MANITDILAALESVEDAIDHADEIISLGCRDDHPNEVDEINDEAICFKSKINKLVKAINKAEYDADPYDPSREGHPNEYL